MTPEEFRRFGHQLIDLIGDYRESCAAGDRPVLAAQQPGALLQALPDEPPESAEPFAAVLADLERLILPGCTGWQDPRFFAFFPSNSLPAAVLGDLASTGLAQLGLNWEASPALTELEQRMCEWMRQALALPASFGGTITDAASSATLVAAICAREHALGFPASGSGSQQLAHPLIVYASAQSHSSVQKAVLLAGYGQENLRIIAVDGKFAMQPDALAQQVRADLAAGLKPCAVIASCGTTATTALDPIDSIAAVCAEHGLWLHVDAAMAGSAMIVPEYRWMWRGIERADSLVINPHKWLGASFDCSLYFVRDPRLLMRVMSSNPSYLQSPQDTATRNYRDWGIPLGRRFRALKLWFLLREQGLAGLRARMRRDVANAAWLAGQVGASEHWRVLAPVPLQTVCVRHEPPQLSGSALDEHTHGWVREINASGEAYLTPAKLGDRWMVRVSIGSASTERRHVEALWQNMQRVANRRLTK
ncbi:MAG: pyridoxal-dependent decarboxylase [Steroidobacteraceae bacterium]